MRKHSSLGQAMPFIVYGIKLAVFYSLTGWIILSVLLFSFLLWWVFFKSNLLSYREFWFSLKSMLDNDPTKTIVLNFVAFIIENIIISVTIGILIMWRGRLIKSNFIAGMLGGFTAYVFIVFFNVLYGIVALLGTWPINLKSIFFDIATLFYLSGMLASLSPYSVLRILMSVMIGIRINKKWTRNNLNQETHPELLSE